MTERSITTKQCPGAISDIVHSHAEHVEKNRRVWRGNTMSCRHRSMVGSMANPPHPSPDCNPEEDICSEADSDAVGPQGACSTLA